ncbi:head maturation protease, ClpP-related [Paraclostridium sp. AKS81]|uniref:head maturation protease, ClpP-related n=1 Tax=Paraclostridium sp. AKS81 TaxID=2876117 RepID=UPI0021DFD1D9|nr:head maturation protease, ClpP-related [Paraclostridium sp. AKS81]MCU9811190.1 ATP-dependent Clp protease proteolytic subunit [Paraclostridium sp. AKS81]
MENKYFNIVQGEKESSLYIYGDIVSGSDKWDETDITLTEFKEQLDSIGENETLNVYINSGGGSVMTGINIGNLLSRHKGTKNVYIDALGASIASVIAMSYDNLYMYENSMLMIHKPLIGFNYGGNAVDFRKLADDLDRIEDNMLIPTYMSKANDELTEEVLRDMLEKETWLGAKDVEKYFKNVSIVKADKEMIACTSDYFEKYSKLPESLKIENKHIDESEEQPIILTDYNLDYYKAKLKMYEI